MLLAALFCTATVRHNGFYLILIVAPILSILYLKKVKRIIPIIALLLVLLWNYALVPILMIGENAESNMIAGFIPGHAAHAVGSVFYYGKDFDEPEQAMIISRVTKEDLLSKYFVFDAAPLAFQSFDDGGIPVASRFTDNKLNLYLLKTAITKYPVVFIRSILDGTDVYWSVFQSASNMSLNERFWRHGLIDAELIERSYGNETLAQNTLSRYLQNIEFSSTYGKTADDIITASFAIDFVDVLLWREGVYIILLLLLGYAAWQKRAFRLNIIILPHFINLGIFMVTSIAQCYRYTHQVFLTFPFILIFYLSEFRKKEER
jgi:hypothetical protein